MKNYFRVQQTVRIMHQLPFGGTAVPSVPMLVNIYDSEAIDPAYQPKSHAISCAIQELGMGRYQVRGPYRAWDTSSMFR